MTKLLTLILFMLTLAACQVEKKAAQEGGLVVNHGNASNAWSVSFPSSGWYKIGDQLNAYLTFPLPVTVTGTPKLTADVGGSLKDFNYVDGNGTETLTFRYTVQVNDLDTDGIGFMNSISLNGGALTFLYNGNTDNCVATFSVPSRTIRVDGVAPTLSSVTGPTSGFYLTGQSLIYTLGFSEPVYNNGTPGIPLELDSGTVPAYYLSGAGSTSLTFRRMVLVSDSDTNGFATGNSFDFVHGTLRDVAGNTVSAAFPITSAPGATVNVSGPYITSVTAPAPTTYSDGQNMDFTVNFAEAVTVTGTPRLNFTLTTGSVYASYISGSGTSALTFRHTVAVGEEDLDGIVISTPLTLNGGTIKSTSNGFDASLGFTSPSGTGRLVDGKAPAVTSVTAPSNGTYGEGQALTLNLTFNEPVTVAGTPRVPVVVGASTRYMEYISGSGTSVLSFAYSVQAGEQDLDGVAISGPIQLNGGSIIDGVFHNAVLTFTAPTTSSVLVDAVNPIISSITPSGNGSYRETQNLDFTAVFSKNVTVTGTPRISLTVGTSTVYANYVSGSGSPNILFRYTVQAADLDTNGIVLNSPVELNGGSIKDSLNNQAVLSFTAPDTSGVLVDAVAPTLTNVTPPTDANYSGGEHLVFVANFSENIAVTGSPRISLTVGSSTVFASYLSGTGTSAITFRYTVQPLDLDADGISHSSPIDLNGGTLKDAAGNAAALNFAPASTANVMVGSMTPEISSVSAPADNLYLVSQNLDFIVTFNKNVNVTGTPRIQLNIGASTVYANYVSGSGTSSWTFRYTVQSGNYDMDGISVTSPVDLNGGAIKDALNNNSTLTFTTPNTANVDVDASLPVISSVAAPANSTYDIGSNLDFVVTFNKPVDVTGTPRFQLTIGTSTVFANYHSGSGTDIVTFRYTVQNGDSDLDGIASASPLQLNGGSIKDALLNNSSLTFTVPDTTGVIVDAILPAIASVTAPANATYKLGANLDFTVTFNKAVTVSGTPRIAITIQTGGPTVYANYQSGSGSTSWTFRYTVGATHVDTNGITVTSPIDLNSGTIQDSLSNNSSLTFTAPDTTSVNVDGVVPTISSVTAPANATYKLGANLDFTVNWSEAVTITGSPRIAITITTGGPTVYATYNSGSGTSATVFRYTVAAGHSDTDGITVTSPLALNGGTIVDAATNAATPLTFTPPTTTNVKVDGIAPTISSVSVPASSTYIESTNVNFTVTWSEAVTITGSPRITLDVGGTTAYATYVSGSGTTSTVFRYTVAIGDEDLNGLAMTSPMSLNGGTIVDAVTNPVSDFSYTVPNTSGVKVDGKAPVLSSSSAPADGAYRPGQNMDFTVTFHETVIVTGTPRLTLTVDATTKYATYVSGSGSPTLTFRYTVAAANAELDLNGIEVGTSIDLNGGTIRDNVSHNAALAFAAMDLSKVAVVYSNMIAWYQPDDAATVTTTACSSNQCVTGISDKSGSGNNITSGTTPGPVLAGSGFGTGNSGYLQFNDASYLNLPNLANVKYYAITMKTDSATSQADIIDGTTVTFYHRRQTGSNRTVFSTNTALRMNNNAVTGAATNISSPQYATSTNYVMWMNISTAAAMNSKTLGSNTFNGQIAEFAVFDNSASLTNAQMDKVRDQMNALHGAY